MTLTFASSDVDGFLVKCLLGALISHRLVEDLCVVALAIVNSNDSLLPATTNESVSFAQVLVLFHELFVLLQLLFNVLHFCASFTWET